MIIDLVDNKVDDFVSVNMGRPSMYNDEDCEWWVDFHKWIEETDIEIIVSSIFYEMKNHAENKIYYGGGGFRYLFWFKTQEDVNKFKEKWPGSHQPELMKFIPRRDSHHLSFRNKDDGKTFAFYEEEGSVKYNNLKDHADQQLKDGKWEVVRHVNGIWEIYKE